MDRLLLPELSKEAKVLRWWATVLWIVDAMSWLFWVAITSYHVNEGSPHSLEASTAGFVALVSPHTVIIPTLMVISEDLKTHCTQDEQCVLQTPRWQWYVFPILVVPFDAVTLAYNFKVFPENKLVQAASVWALIMAVAVLVWGGLSGVALEVERKRQLSGKVVSAGPGALPRDVSL